MRLKAYCLLAFAALSVLHVSAQKSKNESQNNGVERPKLVVGIVVDQMRWDYLYRFYNRYSEGGFKRLIKKGFSCDNTMIPYTPTVTAAGHTCLYTGSVPAVHGIVGNDWVERATGEYMYCTQDKSEKTVGSYSNDGQMSPRNLMATTVGDELRSASNKASRVFGIAIKDRGGILPAGQSANAAYWFDDSTGNWITSTYYMKTLPGWVQNFNNEKRPDAFLSKPWSLMYDDKMYDQSVPDDSAYARTSIYEISKGFPHSFTTFGGKNYNGFRATPFGNTFTLDFAKQLLDNEKLGMSGQTDMLCISLSSTDYIGHRFGPQSKEIEDCYLRLDKDLESFFATLDKEIGEGQYTIFLSADHGAVQTPAFLKDSKLPGGTLSGSSMWRELNLQLLAKYKVKGLLQNYFEYQFYFDNGKMDSAGINRTEAEDFVVNYLLSKPEVANAFSYRNFDKLIIPEVLKEKLRNGYFAKRSGDIQMILKPQYTEYSFKGTDHGAWYPYDSHIPLLFYGWGIRQGKTNRETYMTDVAATLTSLLHIQMPGGCVGKVILEAVK